jgi:quercetin dioxygenase-like cupin family protein
MEPEATADDKPAVLVLEPEDGRNYWQPEPANGHVSVRVAPGVAQMAQPFAVGTQTVAAGCYVREHDHPNNDEVIHVLAGTGRATIDGADYPMRPGVTLFLGRGRRHAFYADAEHELTFLWTMVPGGLEDFFAQIGREKRAGDEAPEPFARPSNVGEIERKTVFSDPTPPTA